MAATIQTRQKKPKKYSLPNIKNIMTGNDYFLDTNIILRHLRQDHPALSPKASTIIRRIAEQKINAYIHSLVLHEALYVLEHVYNNERKDISNNISQLLQLENLLLLDVSKQLMQQALTDYASVRVDFPDCLYGAMVKERGMHLLSFDKDFQKLQIPTLTSVK